MVDTPGETRSGSQEFVGRRTDEWSECLTLIAAKQDRAAFTRFFRHFAPLIKAFALSGSSLSASVADELVQEVMLKVWQKAGGFNRVDDDVGLQRIEWMQRGARHRFGARHLFRPVLPTSSHDRACWVAIMRAT